MRWAALFRRRSTVPVVISAVALSLYGLQMAGSRVAASQPAGTEIAFVAGGTLIDGTGGGPISNAAIVIESGRITKVGTLGEMPPPEGAAVLDATGKFIVPGLIDTHIHYRDWLGEMFLAHGVTSAFDLGDPTDWILAVRDGIAQGLIRGPRLYVSGNLIDGRAERDRASMGGGGGSHRNRRNRTQVGTTDEARQAVRDLAARGVDLIKVYQDLTPDQLAVITEEAHRTGLSVFGHTYDVVAAAQAGIDVVTHLWGVATTCMTPRELQAYHAGEVPSPYPFLAGEARETIIQTLVAERTYLNPLIVNEHAGVTPRTEQHAHEVFKLLNTPELHYVPQDAMLGLLAMFTKVRNYATRYGLFPPLADLPLDDQEKFRIGYLSASRFVGDFARAGGKLLAGSDSAGASITPGLSLHHELSFLVDAGVPPMQALQAATKFAGELVHDEVGTIEPGKRADLLIVDGDPLADISNLRRLVVVVKDGRRVDTRYHREYSSSIPYPIQEFSSSYLHTPILNDIAPKGAPAGTQQLSIVVDGSGFGLQSVVLVASRPVPTRFISPRRLEATLASEALRMPGTLPVSVWNPRPGGGQSNSYGFVIAPARIGPAGEQ